jgi:hypothetical protein
VPHTVRGVRGRSAIAKGGIGDIGEWFGDGSAMWRRAPVLAVWWAPGWATGRASPWALARDQWWAGRSAPVGPRGIARLYPGWGRGLRGKSDDSKSEPPMKVVDDTAAVMMLTIEEQQMLLMVMMMMNKKKKN